VSYCEISKGHPVHGPHHDSEYGRPVDRDEVLLERIALEINQAGLSWLLILKKRAALYAAFEGFDPATVSRYGAPEVERLLNDASIIRNRRKIEAVIENARRILVIQESHGCLAAWIEAQHPLCLADWVKRMRETFVFMGPEVVNEFFMSIGYLPGAHDAVCPVGREIAEQRPPWMRASPPGGW